MLLCSLLGPETDEEQHIAKGGWEHPKGETDSASCLTLRLWDYIQVKGCLINNTRTIHHCGWKQTAPKKTNSFHYIKLKKQMRISMHVKQQKRGINCFCVEKNGLWGEAGAFPSLMVVVWACLGDWMVWTVKDFVQPAQKQGVSSGTLGGGLASGWCYFQENMEAMSHLWRNWPKPDGKNHRVFGDSSRGMMSLLGCDITLLAIF